MYLPSRNVTYASSYLNRKHVRSAFMFGSGVRKVSKHDLDIAVNLPPTSQNKRKFSDAYRHGIDLFLLDSDGSLFSVANDDLLWTDNGEQQGLEDVRAKPFTVLPNPTRVKFGYNSHGSWSTLGAIEMEEKDRGNEFPVLNYPADTPAIWICLTPRKALRYTCLAENWEHLDNEREPLTREEREMTQEVTKVPLKPTDLIVFDDGDEGFLLLRP